MTINKVNLNFPTIPFLAFITILFFNNWLLGLVFSQHLIFSGGSISDLSALSQPNAWLFRVLDVVAGLLLIYFASVTRAKNLSWKLHEFFSTTIFVLGVSNIIDAVLPLPCAEMIDKHCYAPIIINLHHITLPIHVYSSVVIGTCLLLLPILGFLYAREVRNKFFAAISLGSILVMIIFLCLLMTESMVSGTLVSKLAGYTQEVQMLFFAYWFIYAAKFMR